MLDKSDKARKSVVRLTSEEKLAICDWMIAEKYVKILRDEDEELCYKYNATLVEIARKGNIAGHKCSTAHLNECMKLYMLFLNRRKNELPEIGISENDNKELIRLQEENKLMSKELGDSLALANKRLIEINSLRDDIKRVKKILVEADRVMRGV